MCPLCIGTATVLASTGTSATGLAAYLLRRRTREPPGSAVPAAGDNAQRPPANPVSPGPASGPGLPPVAHAE